VLARVVGAYTKAKGGDLFIGVTHVGDDAANSRTDFARRDPRFRRALFPRGRGAGVNLSRNLLVPWKMRRRHRRHPRRDANADKRVIFSL